MGLRRYFHRMHRYLIYHRLLFLVGIILAVILWLSLMWAYGSNNGTKPGNRKKFIALNSFERDNIDGIIWRLPGGKDEADVLPSRREMLKMSYKELAGLYHSYINKQQLQCDNFVYLGNLVDGGRYICDDKKYRPKQPCLVYSFGIGYDFSFDDNMAEKYHCEVHSFDPSMNSSDSKRGEKVWFHRLGLGDVDGMFRNGWNMKTLSTIKSQLNHGERELDVLKVDIEEWEWVALPNMIKTGALKEVRQMAIEMHIAIGPEPLRIKYLRCILVLKDIYTAGFRILLSEENHWCDFVSIFDDDKRTGCHDMLFVRIT